MNILDLIQQDNIKTTKKATTHGGEYKGPCPWCEGDDRFTVWPNHPAGTGGRYICRKCGKSGDAVNYLRDFRKMTYKAACFELAITPDMTARKLILDSESSQAWAPREIKSVPEIWTKKAEALLFQDFKTIMSPTGQSHREYLASRGLSVDTIKRARIGLRTRSLTFDREAWGIEPEKGKNGKDKAVWIPEGLIIPCFDRTLSVVRLRVRQDNPLSLDDRYIMLAGSATAFLHCFDEFNPALPSIIIESELDGWLVAQKAGDLVNVFAIGNAQARPDVDTDIFLKKSMALLICLDADAAGRKELPWWQKHYPGAVDCEVPAGKDPGEAYKAGVDIREWILSEIKRVGAVGDNSPRVEDNVLQDDTPFEPVPEPETPDPQKTNLDQPTENKTSQQSPIETAESLPAPPIVPPVPKTHISTASIQPATHCMHGQFCGHLSFVEDMMGDGIGRNICLFSESPESVFSFDICPKNIWKRHREALQEGQAEGVLFETVILLPVLKHNYRQKKKRLIFFGSKLTIL